jgi:hypothetical protein
MGEVHGRAQKHASFLDDAMPLVDACSSQNPLAPATLREKREAVHCRQLSEFGAGQKRERILFGVQNFV